MYSTVQGNKAKGAAVTVARAAPVGIVSDRKGTFNKLTSGRGSRPKDTAVTNSRNCPLTPVGLSTPRSGRYVH